jgi:hypothetical protein
VGAGIILPVLNKPAVGLPKSIVSAKLPFMTRFPKKRGVTQIEGYKSLILRQN